MKRARKPCASYTSPLPPCKICGAKASGLHYGVNTCEACKGFFRRAIKFQRKYKCFQQQKCDVTGDRRVRTSCPFCRLQKCLKMGMAHNAIKTGRYTHAKRTENIMEVKRLENVSKKLDNSHYGSNKSIQILMDCGMPRGNGLYLIDHQSLIKSEDFKEDFRNVQVKQESWDEMIFSEISQEIDNLQREPLKFEIFSDYSYLQSQLDSETFGNELAKLMYNEIKTHLEEEVHKFAIKKQNSSSHQGQGFHNQIDVSHMDFEKEIKSQFPDLPNHGIAEAIEETESEGVYISIPSPPLSSCNSNDDSCFDFSFGSSEQPHVIVLSSPVSENRSSSAIPLNDIDSSFTHDYGDILSPATTPPSESMASPDSSCSSSHMLSMSPQSDLNMTPLNFHGLCTDTEKTSTHHQMNEKPFFHTISKMVDQDHNAIVEAVLQVHRKHVMTLAESDGHFIKDTQQKFLEKHQAQAEIFGLTSHYLKDEIYEEIFHETGLDVDGRHEMLFKAGKCMSVYLQSLMKFAINIPGFRSLLPEDQASLIASALVEQWFLNAFSGMNKELSIILMPNLQVYSIPEMSWLMGKQFVDKCFSIAPTFQKQDIPYEVLVIWKVVLLFSTDRDNFLEPEKVSELQNAYANCLLKMTNKLKEKKPGLFARLINLTMTLRELVHTPFTPLLMNESSLLSKVKSVYVNVCRPS